MRNSSRKTNEFNLKDINHDNETNLKKDSLKEIEIQSVLLDLCKEILDKDNLDIDENFFKLGGHSLKAIELECMIEKEFNVEIPISEIFKVTTIKEIGNYISKAKKTEFKAIAPVEEREYYPVSSAEKRMFILNEIEGNNTNYNIPIIKKIEGNLDRQRFTKTIEALMERHESLRTSFRFIDEESVQIISENVEPEISFIKAGESEVYKIIKEFIRPFDLSKAPLMRVGLIELSEEEYILIFDIHHIVADGVSVSILLEEFSKLYEGEKLSDLKIQYKDYSVWQNNLFDTDYMKKQEEYWLDIFKDEIPVLNLPIDYSRPLVQSFEGDSVEFKLEKEATKAVKEIARETVSTMYMVLLAGINVVLSKYSGQEDIIVGSAIAGRNHADLEGIIGMFVNTLAMRNYPEGTKTYKEFLMEVKETALKAYENQDYQFEELVDKLNLRRDTSRNPLFDVMFVMQNMDKPNMEMKNIVINNFNHEYKISKFDLLFLAIEYDEEIYFEIQYCTRLFKKETIERMTEHLKNIFKVVAEDRNIKLSEIEILSEAEKNKLLFEFNDTYADYPREKTIQQLFEEQVERTPNNIAVVFEDKKLTYKELNERANSLARVLREKGVKSDTIVGIMVERSLEMIVGIMAILKAGGAYLPISPEYPEERIKYMLNDSNSILLVQVGYTLNNCRFDVDIIDIKDEWLYKYDCDNLINGASSKSLSYIIYTSGSTGKPKGVMVEHRSAIRLVKNTNYINFNEDDKILQTGTLAFDASTFEIWGALLNGLEIHLGNKNIILSSDKMEQYIEKKEITILWLTASLFNWMSQEKPKMFKNLKYLLVGGDVLSTYHINRVMKECERLKIINGYGPTENTTFSTCLLIDREYKNNIPIGKPISNSTAYIIDKYNKLKPIGLYGEICVGGDGLARGYLNNAELTTEKFVDNPFVPGEKMYKTGDLGRWLPDGNIEFLGRIDHQVKIRGFRIELAEIENRLLGYEKVKEAIVIDKVDSNVVKYLCAYVVSDEKLSIDELRHHLLGSLPDYMIPSYFIQLEKMPLTSNGKVDRKSLPEPYGNVVTRNEYMSPTNELEQKLVDIWKEVLKIDQIGIKDNFFEIGGHSLKAIVLSSKISKEFSVELQISKLFNEPTIREIAVYIGKAKKKEFEAIVPVEEREYYPVSSAEKRMFILNQMEGNNINYNIPIIKKVEGKLDRQCFINTIKALMERHESLRTSFKFINEEPVQIISKNIEPEISFIKADESEVDKIIKEFIRPFDLSKAPLMRVGLIELSEEECVWIFDIHHIVADGVSVSILLEEFSRLYEGEKLSDLKIQYKDYAVWQNKLLDTDYMKKQEEYWLNTFKGEIPVLNLPIDYSRPLVQSFEGDGIGFRLEKEVTKALKEIAIETGSTMYMVLLAGINVVLSKYSGQEDIIVGTPIAGRNHADLEGIVGMFVNTLAMRNHPESTKTYKEFLMEVKETALNAYENQEYQFEELVDKLNLRRDTSRNPLFDVMFVMQNMDKANTEMKNISIKGFYHEYKISKFDLSFSASENDDELILGIEYCTRLFKKETIERIAEHVKNTFKVVAEDRDIKLSEIEILSEAEKNKLLFEFNDTYADYPKEKTIHQLFEEQVERTPNNIAVVFEEKKLTYKELNERSNSLARVLREKGVKPDAIVGIMVERSLEMIVGIIGILKAGGAYLPISPEYPEERIEYMLNDSNTNILLIQNGLKDNILFNGEILNIQDEKLYEINKDNLECINKSKDLAYIIYTSGTTGNPKGVMIEHKALVNRLNWMQKKYPLNEQDTILQKTTYTFDVSVWEILWWSIVGAKVCMLSPNYEKNPIKIIEAIDKYKVTTMHFVPSMLDIFLDCVEGNENSVSLSSLRQVFSSGEALNFKQIWKFYKEFHNSKKLINLYGPTEATIDVSYFDCNNHNIKAVPIGKPIDNIKLYILKNNKAVPLGVAGELYIAGDGLARGYINRPELTAEKFIDNPFAHGEKMYKTGDIGRWLPDGNIEFLGRVDHQVKIRGFRIELGEIENRLLGYEKVREAIVVDKEDSNGVKYLCAYIVADEKLTIDELRQHLLGSLPDYMIPLYFIQLEKMPLTANGKIDRKSLPEPDGNVVTRNEYMAPTNELEEKLVDIWKEVLKINQIGINDNFFEIGGHSLKAIVLSSKISKEFSVELQVSKLFNEPTIREIADYIGKAKKKEFEAIMPIGEREYYPVSSVQKRMYIIQNFDKESIAYNMPQILEIKGSVDKSKIEDVFRKLFIRHEILKTYFETVENEIVQKIDRIYEFKLDIEICNESIEKISNDFVKPFYLEKSPLFRVKIVESQGRNYLLMDMHHIIFDGMSMGVLMNEFVNLYNGGDLEPLKLQYKDFALWQNNFLKSEEMKKQEEYWMTMFNDEIPVLNIPTDYERPVVQSFEGANITFEVDRNLTSELKSLTKKTASTMHMILLSAFNILLYKYSGQEDVIIGTPISGRHHIDLQNIIGMFVNTLALRNKPEGNKKYIDFINEVKENSLRAYDNQIYQLETLIEKLNIVKDRSRNPLFDVMFNMADAVLDNDVKLNDISLIPYGIANNVAKFDLVLSAIEQGSKIIINIGYCSKIFNKNSIDRLGKHYLTILERITDNDEVKLGDIELIDNDEKKQLLYDFNDTKINYQKDKTIQELFEIQVEKTPDNIAIIFEDKKLTYRELNEKSNSLARLLRNKGVKENSIIGIMVDRSLEMVIGIIGVLKAGGAYLPIDPSYPKQRIEYMLSDSQSQVLLTSERLINYIQYNGEIVDLFKEQLFNCSCENLEKINNSDDLGYVIYTSGTTGNPKGVMLKHSNLNNFLMSFNKSFNLPIGYKDKVLSLTNYIFDVSVCEIFSALTNGATLVINDKHKTFDPTEISRLIVENEITFTYIPPLLLTNVYEELKKSKGEVKLNKLLVGVEAIRGRTLNNFYELNKDIEIINGYGPTETTICSTFYKVDGDEIDDRAVPIGKPIGNTQVYILNNNKLQPIGVPGELCISGDGVSNGYLNNAELTKEKFVDNPFEPKSKIYKTGDLARWLPDGNIEFLGRIDNQVKIRGVRIELGEIENAILKCSGVKQTVVVVRERQHGEKYLVAFVEGNEIDEINIRKELRNILPNYMRPDFIVEVDKMPITTSGKLDRRALHQFEKFTIKRETYVEVKTETEKIIATIWEELLNLDSISLNDSFFEIGGNSLLVVNMVDKIQKQMRISIEISDIYKYPILEELSMIIDRKKLSFEEIKEDVILLRNGSNNTSKKLIFVHGGSGSIGGYVNLFREDKLCITEDYDVYAIKFDKLKSCAPMEISINQLAKEYVSIIEKYFIDETIVLGGWCIGSLIIMEMANILERKGVKVEKLLIFNALAPRKWEDKVSFNLHSETQYLKRLVDFNFLDKIVGEAKNIEELWELVLPTIIESTDILDKIPKELLTSIPNYKMLKIRDVIYYLNCMRTLHNARLFYIPKERIKTKVYYFNAIRDKGIDDKENNVKMWQKYCENKIEVLNIYGDEHTIFDEDIKDTINKINQAILES